MADTATRSSFSSALGKLNEGLFGDAHPLSSCLGLKRGGVADQYATCRERYADFLGCSKEPGALQRLTVAHAAQIAYATSSEAVSVALPYINGSVGGDVQTFAAVQSVAAGMQLVGGLAFGSLSDKLGSRVALVTAHVSALSSALLITAAQSQSSLLLGMVPYVTMHGFQAAAQVAVKCSTQETRAVAMGRIGMSYGVGFFTGTLLTSVAATHLSPRGIAGIAAAVETGVLAVVVVGYPPEPAKVESFSEVGIPSLSDFMKVVRQPRVATLLFLKMAVSTSGGMIFCMTQQFAMDPFGFSAAQTSLLMAYVGGMQLLSQGALVPRLGRLSPRALRLGAAVAVGIPLLGLASVRSSSLAYVLWVGPLTTALHTASTAMNSMLSCLVEDSQSGIVVALGMAPMTLGFLVSPLVSGWVFHHYGFSMVPMVAAGSLLVMVAAAEALDYAGDGGCGERQATALER